MSIYFGQDTQGYTLTPKGMRIYFSQNFQGVLVSTQVKTPKGMLLWSIYCCQNSLGYEHLFKL